MSKIFGSVLVLCSQHGIHIVLRTLVAVCEMSLDYSKRGHQSKIVNRFYFRTARDLKALAKITEDRARTAGTRQ